MNEKEIIKKYAILNRLKYGKAYERAVLGKVLALKPELRKRVENVSKEVLEITEEINNLPLGKLQKLKEKGEAREIKTANEKELKLPDAQQKKVRTRLAPNPNGAMTLGSARGIIVNSYLAKKYEGKFILRFDDTDPKTKAPMLEAYQWYLEDSEWLESKPDEVYYASERVPLYYEYAEKLIKLGKAYVCFCEREKFKKLKDSKQECPHRIFSIEKNLDFWKAMLNGEYKEGEAVLRIKTDMEHKDPALRDWVGFRILDAEHPRVGKKFRVWPMLDFESAIEDHLLKLTHIIRGKELADSERRQNFIYKYLKWKYPKVIHWGRVRIREFGRLSTSEIRKGIILGKYKGWDDPKLPTIKALRRRGISPKAIRNFILNLGINESDISLSLENLFAENRKIIDKEANRYFFVEEPIKLLVKRAKPVKLKIPLHPDFRDRGYRNFNLSVNNGEEMELFISGIDAEGLEIGEEIRLMNLFNIKIEKKTKTKIMAKYLREKNLHVKKIQWVQSYVTGKILMSDKVTEGFCEENCRELNINEVIQFERFGFVKLEEKNSSALKFCFGHK